MPYTNVSIPWLFNQQCPRRVTDKFANEFGVGFRFQLFRAAFRTGWGDAQ
jgi:hypothetical protein